MAYQLFKNGQPIAKKHSTWEPCAIEAFERGLVTRASGYNMTMAPFCEIKEIPDKPEQE